MKKNLYILTILLFATSFLAASNNAIERSGDILEYLMPACALTSTFIWRDDSKPTLQFVKSVGLAVGSAYILKKVVKKERPDFNEYDPRYDSFPSGHTTSAFMSAAFMERRYVGKWVCLHTLLPVMLDGAAFIVIVTIGWMYSVVPS